MRALAIALLLALSATRVSADAMQDRREAIKKRIRVMRAATLTDELNLDEKTLSKLLPVLAKYDDVTEDLLRKRVELQRRLEASDPKDHKAIDKLIDESIKNQKAFWDLEERRLGELRRILTPPQTAKLLVVLPAFERKIQNQLRRALARSRVDRGGRRGGDDDPDPDLDLDDEPTRRRGR